MNSEWLKNNLIIIILFITFCVIFFFIGTLVDNIPYLKLKDEVDVISIINLIISFSLALGIPIYVNRTLENRRYEKNMIMSDCDKLIEILNAQYGTYTNLFNQSVIFKKDDIENVLSMVKKVSNQINNIEKVTTNEATEVKAYVKELKDLNLDIWENFTPNIPKENFIIDASHYNMISTFINKAEDKARDIKYYVNKH